MKRLVWMWCSLLALLGASATALGQATTISSITPTSAVDGASSFTMTLTGTFLTTNNVGVCFYTGYNVGKPIVPTTFNNTTAVVTIPASALSSVPANAFSGGTFTASVFLGSTANNCNPATPINTTASTKSFTINQVAFTVASPSPAQIGEPQGAFTLTLNSSAFPPFSSTTNGVCFYTGSTTSPIVPTVSGNTATLTVPATATSSIPQSAYTNAVYAAKIWISASGACTTATAESNVATFNVIDANLTSDTPASVYAGPQTATSIAITGSFPAFSSSTYGMCFYAAGEAAQAPLIPTVVNGTATVSVPASYLQNVPASDFANGSGIVQFFVAPATQSCNPSVMYSNTVNLVVNQYSFTITSTNEIGAGQAGFPLQINSGGGTFPTFSATTYGLCFYTPYATTQPLIPTTAGNVSSVNVPASYVQSIPPADFVPNYGQVNAEVFIAQAGQTCNDADAYSQVQNVYLEEPVAYVYSFNALSQNNPGLSATANPTLIQAEGYGYSSNPVTQVQFTYSIGGTANPEVPGTPTFVDSGDLITTVPAPPAGATDVETQTCTVAGGNTYCGTYADPTVYPLATSTSTLAATPNTLYTTQTTSLTAQFVPGATFSTPTNGAVGALGGTVTFTNGSTNLGTAPLKLNTATATFNVADAQPINSYGQPTVSQLSFFYPDFNKDGIPDVVVFDPTSSNYHLLLGTVPRGDYLEVNDLPSQSGCEGNIIAGTVGDVNGDGFPDLVYLCQLAAGSSQVIVALNTGGIVAGNGTVVLASTPATSIVIGDVNKDGSADIVLGGPIGMNGAVIYGFNTYLGNGSGTTFTAGPSTTSNYAASGNHLQLLDYDQDGYPDIAILNTYSNLPVGVALLRNDHTGAFGATVANITTPATATYVAAPLSSATAYPSILVTDQGGQRIGVSVNPGTGAFTAPALSYTAIGNLQGPAVWADFSGDGNLDVATLNGGNINVRTGNGAGVFSATTFASTSAEATTLSGATLLTGLDQNADGFADILVYTTSQYSGTAGTVTNFLTTGTSAATLPGVSLPPGNNTVTASTPGSVNTLGGAPTAQISVGTPPTATISWATPAAITYGTLLSGTQLNATAANAQGQTVPGTFTYSPAAGTLLTAGSQTLSVLFTPTDMVNYSSSTKTVTLTVNKATPTVSWMTPASIAYPTPLSSTQLDATATGIAGALAGTFTYNPAAGTVLNPGSHPLGVTFTPSDSTDYNTATGATTLLVNLGAKTITFPQPTTPVTFGQSATLTATASNGDPVTYSVIGGLATLSGSTVNYIRANTVTIAANSAATSTYAAAPQVTVMVQVNQATPVITWNPNPATIAYGTPLSSSQLDAEASVPGTFTYVPAAGTVLNPGPQTLTASFVPSDTVDYTNATGTANITVTPPGAFTAPTTPVGSTSATQTAYVTVTTAGTVGAINVLTQGAPNLDYQLVSGGTCAAGTTYAVNQVCSVLYSFTPAVPGARLGGITLTGASGGVLGGSYVNGVGTGPQVTFVGNNTVTQLNTIGAEAQGLAEDGSGNIFVSDYSGGSTIEVRELFAASGYATTQTIGSGFVSPTGVAVDGLGNLFVADAGTKQVSRFSAAAGYATSSAVGSGFSSPGGIAVDGGGNLYVADGGSANQVKKFTAASGYTASSVLGSGFSSPSGIAVDSSQNVFVADASNNGAIKEITAASGYATVNTLGSGFFFPYSISVDAVGNVFVADNSTYFIKEITAASGYTTVNSLANSLSNDADIGAVLVDGRGNLIVADNQAVYKVNFVTPPAVNFPNTAVGSSSVPQSVTVANDGNATLNFSAVAASNNNFSLAAGSTCSTATPLAAGASCTFNADFTPQSAGALSGSLNLTDNSLNATAAGQAVPLSGIGVLETKTITFPQPATPAALGSSAMLTATTSNGDPVTYSIQSGAATLSGATITYTSAGTVTIAADSAANGNYAAAAEVTRSVVVQQGAATVTWNTPAAIAYGTALSATQLNATASVPGTFTYTPAAGTVLGAGTQSLSVLFTPTDTTDYSSVTKTVSLVVTQAAPTLTWNTPASIVYGTALSATQLNATASVPGTFSYAPAAGTVLGAGTQTLSVLFTPTDATDYSTATKTVSLVVTQATPVISWPALAPIANGTPLSSTQLDATATGVGGATLPGVFTYTPSAGTVLPFGTQQLSVSFAPTDSTDYTAATGSNTITVMAPTGSTAPTTPVGSTSATQTVAVNFAVSGTLGSISVLTQGVPNLDFKQVSGGTCATGTSYNSGQTCTVLYSFTPSAPGARLGGISLASASGAVLGTSFLTGVGTGPQITFPSSGAPAQLIGGLNNAEGLALDGSGNIFLAGYSGAVYEVPVAGGYSTVTTVGSGFQAAFGIAVDGLGNLFVADTGAGKVDEVFAAGGYTTVSSIGSGFSKPAGVAVDGSGNVYVSDLGLKNVRQFTAASGYTVANPIGSGFSYPAGVALDASGNVYVADRTLKQVLEVTAASGYTTVTSLGSGLSGPTGVALDAAGNVYVADSTAIREILAQGGYATVNTIANSYDGPGMAVDKAGNLLFTNGGSSVNRLNLATPPAVAFAPTTFGSSSAAQTVTVANAGNAALVFTGLADSDAADFPLSGSTCTATGTLAAGASCSLGVSFTPQVATAITGGINLTDNTLNASGSVQTISLSGTGLAATKTINFPQPSSPVARNSSVTLGATASNGDPVTYTILSGTATLSGATITFTTAGSVTIAANSAATSTYAAAAQVTRTVVVQQSGVAITWNPNPATITYGTALSAAQLDATASVPGTFVYTPALGAVLGAGTQSLSLTFTPTDTTNYSVTTQSVSISVSKANPVVTWANPAGITQGTALSATQLNATASVAGTFVYTPAAGTVLGAGTQTLSVLFTPTDATDYNSVTQTVSIVVGKATPSVTWANPAAIVYGTPLSATQLNATASVAGTFTYTPAAGTVLLPGTQTLSVLFTPTDTTDYNGVTQTVSLVVNNPTTTGALTSSANPSQFGQTVTLSLTITPVASLTAAPTGSVTFFDGTKNLGMANLAGNLASLQVATLTAGSHALTAVYSGDTNYAGSTAPVYTQTVTPATTVLAWTPSVASIVYGTALSSAQLNATVSTAYASTVPGVFSYTPTAGSVPTAGAQTLRVSFTPTDTTDFLPVSGSATITVTQASPVLTWPTPAGLVVGSPLTSTQLDATAAGVTGAALAGTFVYTPPAGTLVTSGNQTLSVVFTPTDTTDYTTAAASVTLGGTPLSLTALSSTTALLGDPAKTITLTGSGFLPTSVVQVAGAAVATTFVNSTTLTAIIPASAFQMVAVLPVTVSDPSQNQLSTAINLSVTAPPVSFQFGAPPTVTPTAQPSVTLALTNPYPVVLTGTLTLTFTPSGSGQNDPSIQFAGGGRTLTFQVQPNTTTTPSVQFQTGTVAGTITLTLQLTAGGVNVTPASIQPATVTLPQVVPGITSASFVQTGSSVLVSVVGYSNTLQVTTANFHFTGVNGAAIANPDVQIPVAGIFSSWFGSTASPQYGSEFTYTQFFTVSDGVQIGSVTVTLVNSVGTSATATTQ